MLFMKTIIAFVVVVIIIGTAILLIKKSPDTKNTENKVSNAEENKEQKVKEFTIKSFVEFVDGKPKPQFDLKEITVNKGDKVRIKITVTKGDHDFKIDEFNVYADTKLNEEMVVEFTADKSGEFVYYCTKTGHRAAGHWGILKVVE